MVINGVLLTLIECTSVDMNELIIIEHIDINGIS